MIFYQRVESLLFIRNIEKNSVQFISCTLKRHHRHLKQCIIEKILFCNAAPWFASAFNKFSSLASRKKLKINVMLMLDARGSLLHFAVYVFCGCKPLYFSELIITYYATTLPSKIIVSSTNERKLVGWNVCFSKFHHKRKNSSRKQNPMECNGRRLVAHVDKSFHKFFDGKKQFQKEINQNFERKA